MIKLSKKSFKKESDPIVDNPSVVVEDVIEPVPVAPDPKAATQVIIAETVVVQGGKPLVERKQEPPKTVTKLPNGTIKQDW